MSGLSVARNGRNGESFAASRPVIVIQNRYRLAPSILFLIALLISVPAHAASGKLDLALRKAVDAHAAEPQPVIVRAKAGQIAAVRAWLKAHGDLIVSEQPSLNALTTTASVDHVNQLAALGATDTLSFNAPVTGFSLPMQQPAAPAATVLRTTLGLTATSATGKGIGVEIG